MPALALALALRTVVAAGQRAPAECSAHVEQQTAVAQRHSHELTRPHHGLAACRSVGCAGGEHRAHAPRGTVCVAKQEGDAGHHQPCAPSLVGMRQHKPSAGAWVPAPYGTYLVRVFTSLVLQWY